MTDVHLYHIIGENWQCGNHHHHHQWTESSIDLYFDFGLEAPTPRIFCFVAELIAVAVAIITMTFVILCTAYEGLI